MSSMEEFTKTCSKGARMQPERQCRATITPAAKRMWFVRMTTEPLLLKRASASRFSGQWCDDDYDVNGITIGRIFLLDAVGPQDRPWMWASGHNGQIKDAPDHDAI